MNKSFSALALYATLLFAAPTVHAWDGAQSGKIANFQVTDGQNFGLRVALIGGPLLCAGGTTWAYLNETDSNYKVYVAYLMMAKTQGYNVTLFTTTVNGYCHIGHIDVAG